MRVLPLLALAAIACNGGDPALNEPRVVTGRTPELGPVIDGNNALALDLYHEVSGEPGNPFFSPFSIATALSMTWAGARGTTSDEMASVLLTNAVYFDADWAVQFDPAKTQEHAFYLANGDRVWVEMMARQGGARVGHVADPGLTVLRLPYQNDEVSMDVLLPDEADGLPGVEAAITPAVLDQWIAAAVPSDDVPIELPKFELDGKLSLGRVLADLGMPSAFDPGTADFTAMADDPAEPLYIQDVLHEARVGRVADPS